MNVKRSLYERNIVSTAMYGDETRVMGIAENKRLNTVEIGCLKSRVWTELGMRCEGELVL